MKRLFLFLLACAAASGSVFGQSDALNPFELLHRLPKEMLSAVTSDSAALVNPFDVVPHREPGVSSTIGESFRPIRELPKGNSLGAAVLFFVFALVLGFFTLTVAANRAALFKAWQSFLNDNALTLAYREATGIIGNGPYLLLYINFLLNAGLLIFLVTRFFAGDRFNNGLFLLLCMVLSAVIFTSKHLLLGAVRGLFPVEKEIGRYQFIILVFNGVLGLFLLPFNFLIAFSGKFDGFLVFWTLGIILVFYAYRALRAGSIGMKILQDTPFHFLLYLCTVEIAPVVLLIKLAMLQTAQ
jgi:hypothetical protein